MRTTLRSCSLVLPLLGACSEREAPESDADASTPRLVAVVDEGFARSLNASAWGTIAGVAVSARGDIAVADRENSRISVLSPAGNLRLVLGRKGSQPGELSLPCCVAFSPRGALWVRDGGNSRYSVFRLGGDSVAFDHTIPIEHRSAVAWAPTTFDRRGRLIDIKAEVDEASGAVVRTRLHREASGTTQERHLIPPPPQSRLGVFTVGGRRGATSTQHFFYAPFGPEHLVAHGPGGQWAEAVSSSYVVTWRDPTGAVAQTLRQNREGPLLSRAERAEARKSLKEQAISAGRRLPFKVPDRKPPLRTLFFDSAGRLWVERTAGAGADRIADVYEQGRLVFVAQWPADVRLDMGAVQPDFAIGVRRDDLDVEHLVRLVFRPHTERSSAELSSR